MELAVLVAGMILVYLAFTEQLRDFYSEMAQTREGYPEIPLPAFIIAAIAVSVPAYFIGRQNKQWAWDYVILVVLMMATANYQGLSKFVDFMADLAAGNVTPGEFKVAPKGPTPAPPGDKQKDKP